jgi:hypothetical protein
MVVVAVRSCVCPYSSLHAAKAFPNQRHQPTAPHQPSPRRVSSALVAAYEAVYELLDDPTAGYAEQGGSGAVKHTPQQVCVCVGGGGGPASVDKAKHCTCVACFSATRVCAGLPLLSCCW